ncbi:MAG: molybdenum ABC transporter ATP-binding protein [Acidobacteria bacterium]|nr:molybdenum ABC transporter ATP-binding protein [Acidobacteriota bacterium]
MTSRSESVLAVRLVKDYSATHSPGFRLDVEFNVPPGVTILFGPSGAGKTTILDCIAGLARPDAGRIVLGEQVLFDSANATAVHTERRKIGYVFQSLALFPHLSVRKNVEFGLSQISVPERRHRAQELLEAFRIANLSERRPAQISGGERQRVALARALVTEPNALLLDEPLAALDLTTKAHIIEDLRAWNARRRIPVLYVTHSHREAFALGELMIAIDQGRVLAQGSPHEVLQIPEHETVAQIAGFENIFDATVTAVREAQGTMTCRLQRSSVELEVSLARFAAGAPVRIAIRAGDILLAAAPPKLLSARNIIHGRIASLTQTGTHVVAHVQCDGAEFLAGLTPGARDALELVPGREVWLVMKSHSCFLLQPASAATA